ncbi:MAG: chemotaxis protein CheB [Bdellovibrionales bacterium]
MNGPLFAVGTSAGGVTVLQILLTRLAKEFTAPLCVIQHLPTNSCIDVGTVYDTTPERPVVEIEDKMPVESRHVYFAPGGYHVSIERDGCHAGVHSFALSQEEPVHFSRPSIDLFFESAARVYGPRLVAALMTGANEDGADGLCRVQDAGGVTVVQDSADAEFPIMPAAALKRMQPDHVITADQLAFVFEEIWRKGLNDSSGRGI